MSETNAPRRKRTGKFKAEVNQVLRLVINSLYSNKEIFLRELLSNASDALEKLRFRALTEPALMEGNEALEVRIETDLEGRRLTITDTGIGMSKDELIQQLGTVAHSGSRNFIEQLAKADEGEKAELIGQFGVGFYSAFLVADRVTVISRSATSDETWAWSSEADETWTLTPINEDHGRGTSVVLHLKEDMDAYLNDWTLRTMVRTYSEYVAFPIQMRQPVTENDEGDRPFEQVNRGEALWRRNKSEVEDEAYKSFFGHLDPMGGEPLGWTHFRIEGGQQFTGLIYLPKTAPYGMQFQQPKSRVKLYVKRVFIMDEVDALVPTWLRFVAGVVESDDLPLNVSRELLQDSAQVRAIRGQVEKKTIDAMVAQKRDNCEEFEAFWESCGPIIKEGIHASPKHRQKLAGLALFASSHGEEMTDLDSYIERMGEDDEAIYYITGESAEALRRSPHVEGLLQAGREVLFLTDPIDEWVVDALTEYNGKPLRNASAGELKLDEEAESLREEQNEQFSALRERIGEVLGERISSVRVTDRLTDSPVCLVVPEGAANAHMERLLRTHGQEVRVSKRIMEINPGHPTITNLQDLASREEPPADLGDWVEMLYDQALLTEGSSISNPAAFAQRMSRLLEQATSAELKS